MSDQIKLLEAYTRLDGFKNNIPQTPNSVQESYVHQYHLILDLLEETSKYNLSGFRVPPHEISPLIASVDADEGVKYTEGRFCKRPILMMKVDAVLSFFKILMNNTDNTNKEIIGFRPE